MLREPQIGGWSPGRVQLSFFIRDYLAGAGESWAQDIHSAYAAEITALPKRRGKGKRKYISYHGFLVYMNMLRRLGLIEYVPGSDKDTLPGQSIKTEESDAPDLLGKRHYIQLVRSEITNIAWSNPRLALYPHHTH